MSGASEPPTGVVSLLFTDIEGSTRLARALGAGWAAVRSRHRAIVRDAVESRGGWVDGVEGDAFFVTFTDPAGAARAAIAAQRQLRAEPWPAVAPHLRVRMGLHVGLVERADDGYVGIEVHRAARVAAAAHGGQLLLTGAARALLDRSVTTEDLGFHRLKDFPVPERLYCAVIDGVGAAGFPRPRTLPVRPTNLPGDRPTLIGRADDVRRVAAAFATQQNSLVTIVGRGGCGKTAVALAAAEALLDRFPGGVWWVPLATVTDPAAVLAHVASAVHADRAEQPSLLDALTARLAGAPTLLVLDNLEHLLAAAPQVSSLMDRIPDLGVLVTSQVRLGLTREQPFTLDTLNAAAAMRLFKARGRLARPGLRLTGQDLSAAREVCRRLDGLPLAIELAAARLAVLTPAELRDGLADSLGLLSRRGTSSGLERHRSLRATVNWSLDLLEVGPRDLFTMMGVFGRAASVRDIEQVAGGALPILDPLTDLIDVAVVRRVEEGDRVVRFELPEALRQVAVERLHSAASAPTWRRAHAQWVLSVLHPARTVLQAPATVYRAAVRMDADAELAYEWARDHDPALAGALAAAWSVRLGLEGHVRAMEPLVTDVLAIQAAPAALRAQVLFASAMATRHRGDIVGAQRLFDQSLALAEVSDGDLVPAILSTRGKMHGFLGDYDRAIEDCSRASRLAREISAPAWAGALMAEAQVRIQAGQLDDAQRLNRQAVDLAALEPSWTTDTLPSQRGDLALAAGRTQEAIGLFLEALDVSESLRDDMQLFNDICNLSTASVLAQRPEVAMELYGLAQAHSAQAFGSSAFAETIVGAEYISAAVDVLGRERSETAIERGHRVPASDRTTRVRQLVAPTSRPPVSR